jgi:hypothetical protein
MWGLVTNNNRIATEITHRLSVANKCYYGLKEQLQSRYLRRKTKRKLYKTLIRPVLLYGSEYWALNRDDEERLKTFDRKILRKIFGPANGGVDWCIRYNTYLLSPSLFYLLVYSRCRGFLWFHLITLRHTPQSVGLQDEGSGHRRDLYLTTQTLYKTNIHATGGIRTHDPSKRSAADLRLREGGYWDRPSDIIRSCINCVMQLM